MPDREFREDATATAFTVMASVAGAGFHAVWGWLAIAIYLGTLVPVALIVAAMDYRRRVTPEGYGEES